MVTHAMGQVGYITQFGILAIYIALEPAVLGVYIAKIPAPRDITYMYCLPCRIV